MLAVPPAYTSQRCAVPWSAQQNRLSQSKFRCQVCGYTANADVNGSQHFSGGRLFCPWRWCSQAAR
ncbi:zinc ribbon domain-containing protein [Escherichia coli]